MINQYRRSFHIQQFSSYSIVNPSNKKASSKENILLFPAYPSEMFPDQNSVHYLSSQHWSAKTRAIYKFGDWMSNILSIPRFADIFESGKDFVYRWDKLAYWTDIQTTVEGRHTKSNVLATFAQDAPGSSALDLVETVHFANTRIVINWTTCLFLDSIIQTRTRARWNIALTLDESKASEGGE